jgi:hypothetical protein
MPAPISLGKNYDYFDSQNFAIVGGTSWKDFVECAQEILDHVKKHQEEILQIAHDREYIEGRPRLMWTPVLIEQVWMSQLMRKRKIPPVSFLGDKWKPFNPLYEPNINYRAKKKNIAHYWSESKKDHYDEIVMAYKKWKAYFERIKQ